MQREWLWSSSEQCKLEVLEDLNPIQVDPEVGPSSSFDKHRVDFPQDPLQVNAPLADRLFVLHSLPQSYGVAAPLVVKQATRPRLKRGDGRQRRR
jgi:hypothetical protein